MGLSWELVNEEVLNCVVLCCDGVLVNFIHTLQGCCTGTAGVIIIAPVPVKQPWRIGVNKSHEQIWYSALSIHRGILSLKNSGKMSISSPIRVRYGASVWVHSLNKLVAVFLFNVVLYSTAVYRESAVYHDTTQQSTTQPFAYFKGYKPVVCRVSAAWVYKIFHSLSPTHCQNWKELPSLSYIRIEKKITNMSVLIYRIKLPSWKKYLHLNDVIQRKYKKKNMEYQNTQVPWNSNNWRHWMRKHKKWLMN